MVCTEVGHRGSYVQSWKCERESRGSACVYSTRLKASDHEMAQHIVFRGSYQGAWSRWLNDQASWNIICIFVALSTRQSASGWLNDLAPLNIKLISVTLSTRQSFSGWLNDEA